MKESEELKYFSIDKESRANLLNKYLAPTFAKSTIEQEGEWLSKELNTSRSLFFEKLDSLLTDADKTDLTEAHNLKETELLHRISLNNKAAIDHEILNMQCFFSDWLKISTEELYQIVKENKNYTEVLQFLLEKKNNVNRYKFKLNSRPIGKDKKFQFQFDQEEIDEYERVLEEQINHVREIISISRRESEINSSDVETKIEKDTHFDKKVRSLKNNKLIAWALIIFLVAVSVLGFWKEIRELLLVRG